MKFLKKAGPCLLLYFLSLAVYLFFVKIVNHGGILTGEETSVAFRDVFLLSNRLQHNSMATNWGGHFFYWLTQKVLGGDLFYGRTAKALAMAGIPPLLYALQIRGFGIRKPLAFTLACWVMLLPGLFNYSWISTENGLECTFGFLAIYFALKAEPRSEIAAVALAAYSAITYGAGLCFTPVVFYLIWRRRQRQAVYCISLVALYAGVLEVPLLWWKNPATILVGGGGFNSSMVLGNLQQLLRELLYRGGSYYYFGKYPAFSSLLLLIPVVFGMKVLIQKRTAAWLWLGLLASSSVYIAAGRESGMRRGVPIVLFMSLFLAVGIQEWFNASKNKPWMRKSVVAFCFLGILMCAVQDAKVMGRFYRRTELPVDYEFQVIPGSTMKDTFQTLLKNPALLSGKHKDLKTNELVRDYEPDRAYTVLHTLQKEQKLEILSESLVLEKIKLQHPI